MTSKCPHQCQSPYTATCMVQRSENGHKEVPCCSDQGGDPSRCVVGGTLLSDVWLLLKLDIFYMAVTDQASSKALLIPLSSDLQRLLLVNDSDGEKRKRVHGGEKRVHRENFTFPLYPASARTSNEKKINLSYADKMRFNLVLFQKFLSKFLAITPFFYTTVYIDVPYCT